MKTMNIRMPEDLHKAMKVGAIQEGKCLKDLVVELLEKALETT